MKIKTAMPVILIVLIFSATSAFAWGHNGKRSNCDGRGNGMNYEQFEDRMENRLERMTVILDLTDDQKKQMEDLAENHWKERQELRKKMQASVMKCESTARTKHLMLMSSAQKHANRQTSRPI